MIYYSRVNLPLCSYFLPAPAAARNHQADQQPTEVIQVASDRVQWLMLTGCFFQDCVLAFAAFRGIVL